MRLFPCRNRKQYIFHTSNSPSRCNKKACRSRRRKSFLYSAGQRDPPIWQTHGLTLRARGVSPWLPAMKAEPLLLRICSKRNQQFPPSFPFLPDKNTIDEETNQALSSTRIAKTVRYPLYNENAHIGNQMCMPQCTMISLAHASIPVFPTSFLILTHDAPGGL